MSELDEQIRELRERTAQVRYQFVSAEIQTCFIAVEMAHFEFSVGNVAMARREIAVAEKGIQSAERFLPDVNEENRPELEQKLADLKAASASIAHKISEESG